ncbi:MAG TPA: hypothetical protein VGX49_11925 [Jatrophihabitans sp.]|nr:hypothetical protein [Jatrophihabitans sp.]
MAITLAGVGRGEGRRNPSGAAAALRRARDVGEGRGPGREGAGVAGRLGPAAPAG